MWPLCTANNFLWLFLPFLIGLLTGWWAFARRSGTADLAYGGNAGAVESPRPDVDPMRMPTSAPVAAFEAPMPDAVPAPAPAADISVAGSGAGLGGAVAAAAGAMALTAIGIPAAVGAPDDLLKIKGIGPKLNALLNGLGVTRFDQIAAWGASEIDKVDDHLGSFKNRITRDSWVEQAGLLASGMIAQFEAKFGKLDSENK